jgi:nucleoside-diphosphate-sugar epimerase
MRSGEERRMRVLVTGATGFVGSHALAALVARGHRVRALVRDAEKLRRALAALGVAADDVAVGDVTDPGVARRALEGCDAVVHAAAVVALEAGRAHEVLATNARSVENVVGAAAELGLGAIAYVSSSSALFTPGGPPIHDDSPLATSGSAYARSKADAERFVRALQREGAPIRCVYPPAVIGPDDPGLSEGNHTIRTFLRQAMVVTSSGFSALDVRDLAAVLSALVELEGAPARTVLAGRYLPWAGLVALMDELTGRRVRRLRIPGPLLRALGRAGDAAKRVVPFDFPLTGEAMEVATQWPGAVDSPGVASLGVRFRDMRESYADTIRWLHRAGHLTARQAGPLAAPGPVSPRRG